MPSMLHPLFTYPVQSTSWLIVIARGAAHFYYDTHTKISVWQLSDTNIDDFSSKVNFDDLAVLFAKANGLKVGEAPEKATKRKSTIDRDEVKRHERIDRDDETGAAISEVLGPQVDAIDEQISEPEENSDMRSFNNNLESSVKPQLESAPQYETGVKPSAGIDLGYSSSEESEGDDEEGVYSHNNSSVLDQEEGFSENEGEDVNNGLDLAFESEEEDENTANGEDAKKEFEGLLDQYENEISIYDPWFLVEEELLPQFSQHPAYYGVADAATRESIFDNWVSLKTEGKKSSQCGSSKKFPTSKIQFFQYLQNHKTEVRKTYYSEFYKKHATEIDALGLQSKTSLESLYRELRVTLNDHAEYERATKKRGAEGNLKVMRVEAYLRQRLEPLNIQINRPDIERYKGDGDFFDCWVNLCNDLRLPDSVVSDATNFILGDEKRLATYLRVLGPR